PHAVESAEPRAKARHRRPGLLLWILWFTTGGASFAAAWALTTSENLLVQASASLAAGDPKTALALARDEEARSGLSTEPEAFYVQALAALELGDLSLVATAAEAMAARGGPDWFGLRDFLLGNAAFRSGERSEAEATLIEADPTALDLAIDQIRRAKNAWADATSSRDDWPAARRNLARANIKLAILEFKRDEAEAARKTKKEQEQRKRKGPTETEEREAGMLGKQRLDARALAALLQKIEDNEAQKREVRTAQRSSKQRGVERDW
ncbi:MAG: hypothetical protein KDC95_12885, partial [Planctomycetes bacterium]|nr:hypothetical protein [Planctomycetota bacterium]